MNFREILIRIIGMTTPYVYDNNISLLELVRRLYKFVNELATCVQELDKEFTDLKDYVNNYFDNLDISSEIKTVLNEMIDDGTLANIINDELLGNINNEITSINEALATVNSTLNSHATELTYLTYRDRFQVANCSANSNYAITNSNFTIQNDDVIFIHFNEALDGTKDATLTINGIAKSVITKEGTLYKGSDIENQDIILRVTDAGLIQVVDILYFQEQINDNKEDIESINQDITSINQDITSINQDITSINQSINNTNTNVTKLQNSQTFTHYNFYNTPAELGNPVTKGNISAGTTTSTNVAVACTEDYSHFKVYGRAYYTLNGESGSRYFKLQSNLRPTSQINIRGVGIVINETTHNIGDLNLIIDTDGTISIVCQQTGVANNTMCFRLFGQTMDILQYGE